MDDTRDGRPEHPREEQTWPDEPAGPGEERAASEEEAAGDTDDGPVRELADKISELEDRWRRALADLDNYRKRALREVERERIGERARATAEWLPVLDNLERALEHAEAEPETVIQGVRAVLDQARDVVARLGFPRREDEGTAFDPTRHEAVSADADADVPEGTIVRVVRPGYGGDEVLLRPAQVIVAKGRP